MKRFTGTSLVACAALACAALCGCTEPIVRAPLPDAGFPGGDTDGGPAADGGLAGPTVTIEVPADGVQVAAGEALTFRGAARDHAGVAVAAGGLAWTSDHDGQLGLGAEIHTTLATVGAHVVTLTATDAAGIVGASSIHLTVIASGVPVVTIHEPSAGRIAAIGEAIRFVCEAKAGAGHTVANGGFIWTSSVDGQIGIGAEVRTGLATAGDHVVTCTATDDAGQAGHATVAVKVVTNRAPKVTITSPADQAYFKPGQTISFNGTAIDPEDGALTGVALVWKSSVSVPPQIGIGGQIATALPLGDHVITLTAKDTQGALGEATITVHVVTNVPPRCTINEPNDGRSFLVGQAIHFSGSCVDPDGGTVTGLHWTSSLDGQLGLGTNVQTALTTVGAHRIKLCAPDPVDPALIGCGEIGIAVRPNTAPTCAIVAPSAGAVVSAGETVRLEGTVTDAEDPAITGQQPSATWASDRIGQLLTRASGTFSTTVGGTHVLTFTGTDSGGLGCSATRTIRINSAPTASISSLVQNGSSATPFHAGAAVDLGATASDPDGDALAYDWQDGLEGGLGAALTARLAAPVVGHHRVVFTATDPYAAAAHATANFDVLPLGATRLVDPLTSANTNLLAAGSRNVLSAAAASNGTVYVGNDSTDVFRLPSADPAANATRISGGGGNGFPPDNVNQILIDEAGLGGAGPLVYLATKDGLVQCPYSATTGIVTQTCITLRDGNLPSQNNDLQAVALVVGSNGRTYLLVGNGDGLLVADSPVGTVDGNVSLRGKDVRGIAVDGSVAWIATDGDGLFRFDPATGASSQWRTQDGAPSNAMRAVAVGTGGAAIWVATANGLGRYEPASNVWSSWRAGGAPDPGLVGNSGRSVAVARVTLAGVARDVVWVGTDNGATRFDPTLGSMMSLTVADGLPGPVVRTITVLADGAKLFGTDKGLARYVGP